MIITLQCITVRWTKLSRGAPDSAKRAAVPLAFPLLPATLPKKALRSVQPKAVYAGSGGFFRAKFRPIPA